MGELDWHYQKDNGENEWADFGYHKYQITRAYRPIRPEHIVPIIYKRCTPTFALTDCTAEAIVSTLPEPVAAA